MLFHSILKSFIHKGDLKLITAGGKTYAYGDGTAPQVTVRLHKKSLEWSLGLDPDLKIGEAYMEGSLTLDQGGLDDFLNLLLANYRETGDHSFFHWREHLYRYAVAFERFNDRRRARKNVAFHYDMPDELYRFFLDPDRQYSCAYFTDPDNSLEQAQYDKKTHIAAKLRLNRSGLKVLDIGSGWGGLGLYLARETGANVKGVTLSVNQYRISRSRAAAAGLAQSCDFALRDYRQEQGPYDRIVSVGMFEHVGKKNYGEFFAHIARLLATGGIGLVHTIGRLGEPSPVNSFIRKYIFPGAHLPTLPEIVPALSRSGLFMTDIEILRLHYAETLKHWAERFGAHRDEITALFGAREYRKWEFYFRACEAGFRVGNLAVFQIQLSKQLATIPLTRDYMYEWEHDASAHAGIKKGSSGRG